MVEAITRKTWSWAGRAGGVCRGLTGTVVNIKEPALGAQQLVGHHSVDVQVCIQGQDRPVEHRQGGPWAGGEGSLPRVRLECNSEIPVAPGEDHWLLDTSLDEVYWPCSHSRAVPSFPSKLEWKTGLAWANTRGSLNSPS